LELKFQLRCGIGLPWSCPNYVESAPVRFLHKLQRDPTCRSCCGLGKVKNSRGVRCENLKWRFWPGAEETYGSANKPLHAAPAPCCAQREDCKTSDNSENSHVSLVTDAFRELRLDSLNISSQLSYHQCTLGDFPKKVA